MKSRPARGEPARAGSEPGDVLGNEIDADTDPTIVEAECRELGLDWKDIFLRRGNAHLRDHAVLDTIRAI
jgi:hypothetical protein